MNHLKVLLISFLSISFVEIIEFIKNSFPVLVYICQFNILILTIIYLIYKVKNERFLNKNNNHIIKPKK